MRQPCNAWEQMKQVNDDRLREIERKGSADPLYMEHLSRLNGVMDQHRGRLGLVETAMARPALEPVMEQKALTLAQSNYRKAFVNYLRKGTDVGLEALQSKALSVGSDPDGGYLVTPSMSQKIVTAIFESSPIRRVAAVETISSDALEMLDDHTSASAGWTAETNESITDTNTPQFSKRILPVHELYAQPKATQKLLDDAFIDVEKWLSGKVADIIGRMENTAFVAGSGVGQPRGFLTYPAGTTWGTIQQIGSGTSATVTGDSVITLYYSLKDAYMNRASFLMNRSVVQQVRLLKTTIGQYLWQPGMTAGQPDTLLGAPVYMAADMPVAAGGSLSIAAGDFQSGYQIVDR